MSRPEFATLSLGFSPCPNDTFIFNALVHRLVDTPFRFAERLEDVETLNRLVLKRELDVSKISYHLLGHVRDDYCLLRSGGALGRGCGPLVVARPGEEMASLRNKTIAVPGTYTTALLLLRLFDPLLDRFQIMPFDRIMEAVAGGAVDAGLIIHESRFTYPDHGLVQLLDLGEWWERKTGRPIPLGGIVARRSLGKEIISAIDMALRESVEYAFAHPEAATAYVGAHSQEMSEDVCASHIGLYVNSFSRDLGSEGAEAVATLLARGEAAGLIPRSCCDLFTP